MATRNNPFGLRAKLNVEAMAVMFTILQKETATEKEKIVGEHSFPVSDVHQTLHKHVALYGYSKLLQDRSSDIPTGPEKITAMQEVAELLKSGEWEKERKVGAPIVRPEVEALAELKNCTVADIQASLRTYSKEAREKVFSNPKVVALAAQIKAKREAGNVDLSDLVGDEAAVAA